MRRFSVKDMARGYKEMGTINLAISHADFEYEDEAMKKLGDVYDEMGAKEGKNYTECNRFYFGEDSKN